MSLNLAHYLQMSAELHADRSAAVFDENRISYGELAAMVKRVAGMLRSLGVQKGDKVGMMIPNTPHFPVIYYGILHAGATVVPINTMLKAHEILYHIDDSDVKVLFTWNLFYPETYHAFRDSGTCRHLIVVARPGDSEDLPEGMSFSTLLETSPEADMEDTMPDDTAVILYTSGTTGFPKGAELTHFNMFFNAFYVRDNVIRAKPGDIVLAVLPLFHSFGQTCIMNAAFLAGATVTMMAQFETKKTMAVIQRDRVSIMAAVPTMYFFMLNVEDPDAYDLSSIRMAVSGGSSLPLDILNRFEQRYGVRLLEGYGLSETSPVASFNVLDRPSKPGSIGLPIWGCEMRIMREDGSFAATGEIGEIVIRGHNVMKGYYKKPIATNETIVNGWLHTGDLARADEEGYFFIVDRKKDVIIRGGMNIYPREIEEVLYAHPAVLEAAVVGVPDEARGEEVRAYISLRQSAHVSEGDLSAYCAERMARYKCPKEFVVLKALPKGPTGKILKRVIKDCVRKGEPIV